MICVLIRLVCVYVTEPIGAIVRKAVLHSFTAAAAIPNTAPSPPAALEAEEGAPSQRRLVEAQSSLASALSLPTTLAWTPSSFPPPRPLPLMPPRASGTAWRPPDLHNDDDGPSTLQLSLYYSSY